MGIQYFSENCRFDYKGKRKTNSWIADTITAEGKKRGDISIIFCSDEYLLGINKEHLNHDYYTDIITFDYCEENLINGDLFISIDTVAENAKKFGVEFTNELNRVIIHGVLHLCGYKDKSPKDAAMMRSKENFYIAKREE